MNRKGTGPATGGANLASRGTREAAGRTSPALPASPVATGTEGDGDESPPPRTGRESTGGAGSGQFLPIRSRVGKRFQATLPDLRSRDELEGDRDMSEAPRKRAKGMHAAKARYSLDRATALGADLEKYLKLARSLRDGATFDSEEQITSMALQYLHRFDYNPVDAACSLYARHSMEVPKLASATDSSSPLPPSRANQPADVEAQWLRAFYRIMRLPEITMASYLEMGELLTKANSAGVVATEVGVLERIIQRTTTWLTACEDAQGREIDRIDLQLLLHQAEDLGVAREMTASMEHRLQEFDVAYGRLKDAIEQSSRRNQSKCPLDELEVLFAAVNIVNVDFPEKIEFTRILHEAQDLKSTISAMLAEDKVSLTAMREVIAKIELVPVNFETEVEKFQHKMLSAQTWLAKVRKCIPKRRTSRRGGPEPKKMDLESIRALVEDAPCEDSTEMFEMQDLLECADEWAQKVKSAIEGGADVSLEELKELSEEGREMPVDMDEQKFLDAEIAAREWCASATTVLEARKPLKELEKVADEAKSIRKQLHPKKQSRWKPQVERDIHAALDTCRRWVNEVRDVLSPGYFDKVFSTSVPHAASSGEGHTNGLTLGSSAAFAKGKKTMDAVTRLLEKADKLVVDVTVFTSRLTETLSATREAQKDAAAILDTIGANEPSPEPDVKMELKGDIERHGMISSVTRGDFANACGLLDKIASLPLVFEEGIRLYEVIEGEKNWAQRVRDALPPRQSRKKRMSKNVITLKQLYALLEESSRLRFSFPDEMRILTKELEDVEAWQKRARDVVESHSARLVSAAASKLMSHDLLVYSKLKAAKKGLREENTDSTSSPAQLDCRTDKYNNSTGSDGAAGAGAELGEPETVNNNGLPEVSSIAPPPTQTDDSRVNPDATISDPDLLATINVDFVVETIRRETGCIKKAPDDDKDDAVKKSARGLTVMEPLLAMIDESIAALNGIEIKDDRKRVDDLLSGLDGLSESPDDAVKQLESWREQVVAVLEEGHLFNAIAPELDSLSCVVELLEWLQNARSIFYNETLPLNDLVVIGSDLQNRVQQLQSESAFDHSTIENLRALMWPLPYLTKHEEVVQLWSSRVAKFMEDKHAPIDELPGFLAEASDLMLESDAIRCILDEIKKAKLWLSKLKKRLKGLMAKNVSRLSMGVAKTLVEEGSDIALEIPAFELLKEHVDIASDWEKRVLESGIETGQARIANLISLLDEYDRARLVIDLDMHRDVLQSATERYCVCRQPYDGFMVGCDQCDDWFHDNCIGMSKEKAEKAEIYTCPSCVILQELSGGLQRVVDNQSKLWGDKDYAKNVEKQQGAAMRKAKREEKAIERSEMLLFSCNNHMNQLRARIDDIERAKACFAMKTSFESVGNSIHVAHPPTGQAAVMNERIAAPPSDPTASTTPMDPMTFVQRYPSILLPSAKFAESSAGTGASEASMPSSASVHTNSNEQTTDDTRPLDSDKKTPVLTPTTVVPGDTVPNMLAPMLARLSENTERLSALLVAGGVEQQLARMKSEYSDVKTQVEELQKTIRLGKERLQATQNSVDELKRVFVIRQHGLPRAKAWVHRVVQLITDPSNLIRSKFQDGFLSPDFKEALLDAKALEIDHFPEVMAYGHLLRLVGWALVAVALLQERPSREAISEVVVYASEHCLCESNKPIGPLRAIISRMDGWIARAQKCLAKQATPAQRVSRMKSLMNEYSKLPLTCSWVQVLEEYLRAAEMEASEKLSAEELLRTQAEAEAAAVAAVTAAAAVGTPITSKSMRKRKPSAKKALAADASNNSMKTAKKAKTNVTSPALEQVTPELNRVDGLASEASDVMMKDDAGLTYWHHWSYPLPPTSAGLNEHFGSDLFTFMLVGDASIPESQQEDSMFDAAEVDPLGLTELDAEEARPRPPWDRPRASLRGPELAGALDGLVVLNLHHNAIEDVTPLAAVAKSLRLLNLNANAIQQLPPSSAGFWSRFHVLSLLFLSGNVLRGWRDLEGLTQCPRLLWLTVDGNPFMSLVHAREFLVNKLPQLQALNDHVITDIEYIQRAGRSLRFGAQSHRLFVGPGRLEVPEDFRGDPRRGLEFVATAEATIRELYVRHSPSVLVQRVLRGYRSRRRAVPHLARLRRWIARVQAHIRGFLFRQRLRRDFRALVHARGQQELLLGPIDSLFMTAGAHRGLRRLLGLVQDWRQRSRLRKQAIAVKKIRFWCQMVYQRYRYRSQQLLRDEQELLIYYTPGFEAELLEMAARAARRDPVLMTLSAGARDDLLRRRCVRSGVSVLRIPTQERVLEAAPPRAPTPSRSSSRAAPKRPAILRTLDSEARVMETVKKILTPPLVRIFARDLSLETHVLVTEKHHVQEDLAMLDAVERSCKGASGSGPSREFILPGERRALLLHIPQLRHELEKRVLICNKKIRHMCIKQQHRQHLERRPTRDADGRLAHERRGRAVVGSSWLCPIALRPRGHSLTRWERNKLRALASRAPQSVNPNCAYSPLDYPRMAVFIPWSIDMYLQITTALERTILVNVSAGFALSYEQSRRIHGAVVIQSAWRRRRRHLRRNVLEVTIQRALLCLQRWWRHRLGLHRRLRFLEACLVLGASINSRTVFMEDYVYRLIAEPVLWPRVQAALPRCREHATHCALSAPDGSGASGTATTTVSVSLSPGQVLLRSHSLDPGRAPPADAHAKLEAASGHRCAYFPVWLPGGVPHAEESMSSRSEDATPYLLLDRVHMEPTLMERELLLGLDEDPGDVEERFQQSNPFRGFARSREVAAAGQRTMALARELARHHRRLSWRLQTPIFSAEATSFVRLTFDSADEARRRGLVLLAKTYNPLTGAYARLLPIEVLYASAMLRHQWAVTKVVGDETAAQRVFNDCRGWRLDAEFPSAWARDLQQRLPEHVSVVPLATMAPSPPCSPPSSYVGAASRDRSPTRRHQSLRELPTPRPPSPSLPSPSPSPSTSPSPSPLRGALGPDPAGAGGPAASLHLAEPTFPRANEGLVCGIQPVVPVPRPPPTAATGSSAAVGAAIVSSGAASSRSRHQLLTDRLGKPTYLSLHDQRLTELEDRECHVRDLREERERAAEALIVDRRLLQRERAAELAGIHLEMNVKLQKVKYEHELAKLATKELIEREKMNDRHHKLSRRFATTFAAQTGAMMRLAARQAVEQRLEHKAVKQKALAAELQHQKRDELERRQDAKSYWFVNNQKAKREVLEVREAGRAGLDEREARRTSQVRQRIQEDKEIKKMLKLM